MMLLIKQDHIRWSDSDGFVYVGDSRLLSHAADAAVWSLIDDCLYGAILRSLEQTHCARMWFYMSD